MIKPVIVGSIAGFSTNCAIREDDSIPDRLFFPMAETGRDGDRPLYLDVCGEWLSCFCSGCENGESFPVGAGKTTDGRPYRPLVLRDRRRSEVPRPWGYLDPEQSLGMRQARMRKEGRPIS